MWSPRLLALLLLALLGLSAASLVEFHRLDVTSPSFDVDGGVSADERWLRLKAAASVPLKGWNSYDGWDWSVTEKDVILNIDYLAANLSSYGYNIVTIESQQQQQHTLHRATEQHNTSPLLTD